MALPSSGPISASMINVELGRSATAQFSLASASLGLYATFNADSPIQPSSSAPYNFGSWHGYDHSYPAASLSGAPSMYTVRELGCGGVTWTVGVSFTISHPNNTNYKVSVYRNDGSTLVANDVGMGGSWDAYDTGVQGDPNLSDVDDNIQLMVKVIRRSDSTVMTSSLSDTFHNLHGAAC